ncbi:MAG: hypothetical protein V4549_03295 [Bacteroidota bacterium]
MEAQELMKDVETSLQDYLRRYKYKMILVNDKTFVIELDSLTITVADELTRKIRPFSYNWFAASKKAGILTITIFKM